MKQLFTTILLIVLYVHVTAQQPGTLDKTFGESGIAISKTYGGCNDLLIQNDGKIVGVGGGSDNGLPGGFMVTRYNADGTLDFTFGDSGRVVTNLNSRGNEGLYGVLQENGKIVVAGYVAQQGDGNNLALIRYDEDGRIDSSFGNAGVVIEAIGKQYEFPSGIVVQTDGRIIVGGYTQDFSDENAQAPSIYLVRYNEDGSHDVSFGKEGIYQEFINDAFETGGLALQPDGKLLLGGDSYGTDSYPFFVRRYTKDGTPDVEFGINGEARYNFQDADYGSVLHAIALQADGKIIAAGGTYRSADNDNPRATLVQFNADGSTNKAFGENGLALSKIDKYGSVIFDLALQPDGKIVTAINDISDQGSVAFAVARYLADGTLDSSFGTNGSNTMVINDQPTSVAVALQKDGKIVVGGYSVTYNPFFFHVTLARYNSDKDKQPLAIRIKRWLQHHGISWQGVQGGGNNIRYYSVQRSADGIVYKDIAKVSSKVNSYEDAATLNSTGSYYRIAAVSWDGSRTYSNTLLIDDSQQARIFPNPVRDNLQLQGLPANGKTNLSVLDLNGNVRSTATATGTNYSVSTTNLSAGSYLLKIQHNGTTVTQPFVKE